METQQSPPISEQQRLVRVFWDIENIRIPENVNAVDACSAVERLARSYGNVDRKQVKIILRVNHSLSSFVVDDL